MFQKSGIQPRVESGGMKSIYINKFDWTSSFLFPFTAIFIPKVSRFVCILRISLPMYSPLRSSVVFGGSDLTPAVDQFHLRTWHASKVEKSFGAEKFGSPMDIKQDQFLSLDGYMYV